MNEKTANTVIEVLAEKIRRLELDLYLEKCESDRLRKKIEEYEKETVKDGKNNA